jgi:hypothetical protein
MEASSLTNPDRLSCVALSSKTGKWVSDTLDRLGEFHRRALISRCGSVALMIGLALPIIIGMVALGTEVTFLLFKQRQMQSVADAAALGAATALQSGHPAFGVEARGISAYLGFIDGGTDGVTIAVNNPPSTGPQITNPGAVEVIINQPQSLSLAQLFQAGPFNVAARAVAMTGGGVFCVLQLGGASSGAFSMSNGADAILSGCGAAVDSTSQSALSMSGGAQLNAGSVAVVGAASITNGASINPSNAIKTAQPYVPDPYAGVVMPSYSGCNYTNKSYGHSNAGLQTMSPGVYCNGISFTNDANVLMSPGVYFVDRGSFNVGGAVTLNGAGVTIILTSSTGSSFATITIGNGATVTLSAPAAGATAGIVVFGDRRAPASDVNNLGGGAVINVNGALYLPTQTLIFQNGISNPSGCTQLIAATLQLTGGSRFQNNCPTGVAAIGASNSTLVE